MVAVELLIHDQYQLTVESASNGQIALDMQSARLERPCRCSFKGFRLIIMDIGMPVMDGIKATKLILTKMQAIGLPEATQIVALTSFTNEDLKKECLEAGIKKVYCKPLTKEALTQIMNDYFF